MWVFSVTCGVGTAFCKSFWLSAANWRHISGSTLVQVWFVAWRHYALTWIIVDFSSKVFCGIHLRWFAQEFSQELTMDVFRYTCSQIIFIKPSSSPSWSSYLHPDLFPGRKRLNRMSDLHNITIIQRSPVVTCVWCCCQVLVGGSVSGDVGAAFLELLVV